LCFWYIVGRVKKTDRGGAEGGESGSKPFLEISLSKSQYFRTKTKEMYTTAYADHCVLLIFYIYMLLFYFEINMKNKELIKNLFKKAGVTVGGNRTFDVSIKNEKFYDRIVSYGSLGLGESYVDGWWDTNNLSEFIGRLIKNNSRNDIANIKIFFHVSLFKIKTFLSDYGSELRSKNIGKHHYDIGNDVYKAMLDKRMVYTCGYWKDAKNLDEAQEAKLDLICKKIGLKKGMKVLDIGCGWGSFLIYAAQKYKIEGVGITVSENQVNIAKEKVKGLPIEIRLQDYRDVNEKFDRVVSVGMFEHVGVKHYSTYFKKVRDILEPNGLFLLHTIGSHRNTHTTDAWIDKYIFPGGVLPSLSFISRDIQKYFVIEDWHNFGYDYYLTLMEWFKKFDMEWKKLSKEGGYDKKFYRMWKYYLLSCAGSFKYRRNQLWQIVLSPNGVSEGYKRIS